MYGRLGDRRRQSAILDPDLAVGDGQPMMTMTCVGQIVDSKLPAMTPSGQRGTCDENIHP